MHLTFNPFSGPACDDQLSVKLLDLRIKQMCLSLIHRKREVMTIFSANTMAKMKETPDLTNVTISVGYFQVDNQA